MANHLIPSLSGTEGQVHSVSATGNSEGVATKPLKKSEFVTDPVRPTLVDRSPVATQEEMMTKIAHLNKMLQDQGRDVSFSYDEQVDQQVVRVVDNQSGALIRQFPSEELMHAYKHMDHMMGLLFDRRV